MRYLTALFFVLFFSVSASARDKDIRYSQASSGYGEMFFINTRIFKAVELARASAVAKGLHVSGFNDVAIAPSKDELTITFFNSGGLDGPQVEVVLNRDQLEVISIK
jgi:hypothetical protein